MTNKVYGKRQKNDFIKRHDMANLLPELDKAIKFDIEQLLMRNSSEVNRTLRIAALRNDNDSLTDLGLSVRAYLLAVVECIEWEKGRIALKKGEVKVKSDLAFTVYIERAKEKAEKDAKEKAEKAEKEKAEEIERKKATAKEKAEKAAAAKEKAEKDKADEVAQQAAATAIFEAEKAASQLQAGDRNISPKAAQNLLHGLIAGNLRGPTLQELNETIHLLGLARQALARQAATVPNADVDGTRVTELASIKPSKAETTASAKPTLAKKTARQKTG